MKIERGFAPTLHRRYPLFCKCKWLWNCYKFYKIFFVSSKQRNRCILLLGRIHWNAPYCISLKCSGFFSSNFHGSFLILYILYLICLWCVFCQSEADLKLLLDLHILPNILSMPHGIYFKFSWKLLNLKIWYGFYICYV